MANGGLTKHAPSTLFTCAYACVPYKRACPDGQVLSQSMVDINKIGYLSVLAAAVATVRYGFKETRLQHNTRQAFLEFPRAPMYLDPPLIQWSRL